MELPPFVQFTTEDAEDLPVPRPKLYTVLECVREAMRAEVPRRRSFGSVSSEALILYGQQCHAALELLLTEQTDIAGLLHLGFTKAVIAQALASLRWLRDHEFRQPVAERRRTDWREQLTGQFDAKMVRHKSRVFLIEFKFGADAMVNPWTLRASQLQLAGYYALDLKYKPPPTDRLTLFVLPDGIMRPKIHPTGRALTEDIDTLMRARDRLKYRDDPSSLVKPTHRQTTFLDGDEGDDIL